VRGIRHSLACTLTPIWGRYVGAARLRLPVSCTANGRDCWAGFDGRPPSPGVGSVSFTPSTPAVCRVLAATVWSACRRPFSDDGSAWGDLRVTVHGLPGAIVQKPPPPLAGGWSDRCQGADHHLSPRTRSLSI